MTIGHHMMTNGHYKIINTYNIIKSGHRKNSYSVPYKDACFSPILFTSVWPDNALSR